MKFFVIMIILSIISVNIYAQTWPFNSDASTVSSAFGARDKYSTTFKYDFHEGIDIHGDYNTDVEAIEDGVVSDIVYYDNNNETVKLHIYFRDCVKN